MVVEEARSIGLSETQLKRGPASWSVRESVKRRQEANLHLTDDGDGSTELLVDHKSEDAHHGSTAVVQLNGTLGELGLFIECVC